MSGAKVSCLGPLSLMAAAAGTFISLSLTPLSIWLLAGTQVGGRRGTEARVHRTGTGAARKRGGRG